MSSTKEDIQEELYLSVKHLLQEKRKCAVVRPTGCGKTHLAFRFIKEMNLKKVLFIFPYSDISELKAKYSEEINGCDLFVNKTYSFLSRNTDPQILFEKLNHEEFDLIIFDEMHLMGGELCEKAIEFLLDWYEGSSYILGLTATPSRMDGKELINKFFNNNVPPKYGLTKAINDGILNKPYYVCNIYKIEELKKSISRKIDKLNLDKKQLGKLNKEIEELTLQFNHVLNMDEVIKDNIKELFDNKIPSYMKFNVFLTDRKEIEENHKEVIKWFKKAFSNYKVKSLIVTSYKEDTVDTILHNDLKPRDNTIDLVFSINKLTMSRHDKNLTGIIMLRGTKSNNIYVQQMGRVLSADYEPGCKKIIFDFIDNIFRMSQSKNRNDEIVDLVLGDKKKSLEKELEDSIEDYQDLYAHDYVAKVEEFATLADKLCDKYSGKFSYNVKKDVKDSIVYWYDVMKMPLNVLCDLKEFKEISKEDIINILKENNIDVEELSLR